MSQSVLRNLNKSMKFDNFGDTESQHNKAKKISEVSGETLCNLSFSQDFRGSGLY